MKSEKTEITVENLEKLKTLPLLDRLMEAMEKNHSRYVVKDGFVYLETETDKP